VRPAVPALDGVLTAGQVAATGAALAATQEPSGAVPWTPGGHTDVWNHVEAAMAMLVAGQVEAAERAYGWAAAVQRADGSVPMKIVAGSVEDPSAESNMSSYLAVGVWHHWLVRRDARFVARLWPAVRAGLDFATSMQLPFGGIAWAREYADGRPARVREEALLAGSSSIHHALRAGLALADLVGEPQPEWELAAGRLGHALRHHRDLFLDKSTFSMDWYYPVLGGAVRGPAGSALIDSRWEDFVVPGLGVRCVDTNAWVTTAETCELVLALEALGRRDEARGLLVEVQHLRHHDGAYWTGLVYDDDVHWPAERTGYSAAAVVLALDALAGTTPGSDIVRGATLGPEPTELALECGCPSADGVAGLAAYARQRP
jgi:hypothetical protein